MGAAAGLALHPDLAAHRLDQLLGDGTPQSRAAVAPRHGAIGLGDSLEDAPPLVLRYADAGIGYEPVGSSVADAPVQTQIRPFACPSGKIHFDGINAVAGSC